MKNKIYGALAAQFEAHIAKHAMNVQIMVSSPMAIHEHTDFMSAIEDELDKIAVYLDKLEALQMVMKMDA